jgi:hypothetical protein
MAPGSAGFNTHCCCRAAALPDLAGVEADGQPVTAGSTTVFSRAAIRAVAPMPHPTGDSFERVFAWGTAGPSNVAVIDQLVVEVTADADAAAEAGVLRHGAGLVRARADLDPGRARQVSPRPSPLRCHRGRA